MDIRNHSKRVHCDGPGTGGAACVHVYFRKRGLVYAIVRTSEHRKLIVQTYRGKITHQLFFATISFSFSAESAEIFILLLLLFFPPVYSSTRRVGLTNNVFFFTVSPIHPSVRPSLISSTIVLSVPPDTVTIHHRRFQHETGCTSRREPRKTINTRKRCFQLQRPAFAS